MPRYALKIDYHGGPFCGWQRQQGQASVQGAIEAAMRQLEPDVDLVYGAGRTDTGVHATGQVAHLDTTRDWAPFRLSEALNYHLKPAPVAILAAARVADDFHARFDAVERRYLYHVRVRRAPLTHARGLVWAVRHELDAGAMAQAAQSLLGRHDFTTFRSAHCQAKSPVKTLDACDVVAVDGGVDVRLRARSFLHNQVRSLVGSLVQVGGGTWPVAQMGAALAAQDRAACGPVAPADGLYLTDVIYPCDPFDGSDLPK